MALTQVHTGHYICKSPKYHRIIKVHQKTRIYGDHALHSDLTGLDSRAVFRSLFEGTLPVRSSLSILPLPTLALFSEET